MLVQDDAEQSTGISEKYLRVMEHEPGLRSLLPKKYISNTVYGQIQGSLRTALDRHGRHSMSASEIRRLLTHARVPRVSGTFMAIPGRHAGHHIQSKCTCGDEC